MKLEPCQNKETGTPTVTIFTDILVSIRALLNHYWQQGTIKLTNIKILICVLHIRIHKCNHVLGCFILNEAAWAWSWPPTLSSAKIQWVELYLPPCICLAHGQLYLYHISASCTHMCMSMSVNLFQLNLCLCLWHNFLSFCGISQN